MRNDREGLADAEAWWRARPEHRLMRLGALGADDLAGLSDLARVALFNVRRELDPERAAKARRRAASMAKVRAAESAPRTAPTLGDSPRQMPKFRTKRRRK